MALDEKKAQNLIIFTERLLKLEIWKDEHSQQATVIDELYFKKIYKEVQTKSWPRGAHIICVFKARIRKAKAQLELKLVRDVKGKDKDIYKYTSCKRKSKVNGKHCLAVRETVTNQVNYKISCVCIPISSVEDCSRDAQAPAASGSVTKETQHSPVLYSYFNHSNTARIKLTPHLSVFHSLLVSSSLTQPHCEP